MAGGEPLKTDREFDVARSDNILDLEVGELGVEPEFLDDTSVFARRKFRIIFRLGTRDDHLAGGEDQRGSFRFANTHDDSSETL